MLFKPRVNLSKSVTAKVALGRDNLAMVSWTTNETGEQRIVLELQKSVDVVSQLPESGQIEHGSVSRLELVSKALR